MLWRLMGEERVDVVRLAHAVSRVVETTVRAAKEDASLRKAEGQRERDQLAALLELLGREEAEWRDYAGAAVKPSSAP
ncbi:MAG: hypothetical protein QOJ59_1495 [Thermomicrobiales bacterium]|jgi:LPS sulfotransferase NodH|nr:hypothetical protein [Thermomicrobiales bacterium]